MTGLKQKIRFLFDGSSLKQTLLNTAFVLFLLSLLRLFIKQLCAPYGYESWQISEFLINYQGGFVRRGLTGEILFFFVKNFNFNVEWTIKTICMICFSAVCVFFVRAFLKKGYSLYILPLCFFLGGMVLSNSWIRKDCLMLCCLILILWTYNRNKVSYLVKILIINILSIFIILTHEVFAFFALPALLILFWDIYRSQFVILSFISLLPGISAFFLVIVMRGNQETAQAIWDSWHIIANQASSEVDLRNAAAVSSIGWPTEWAVMRHFKANFLTIDRGIFSSLVWCITFPVVYYIATNALLVFRKNENSFAKEHQTVLSSILIFQFLCLSPVFAVLSWDWIRVFFYWITSSFAIFLILPAHKLEKLIPPFLAKFVFRLNNCLSNILFPAKTTMVLLMMFMGISTNGFILDSIIHNSMIYNIISILSEPFIILSFYLQQCF